MARRSRLRGWRRIADAMWGAPNDPQVYGALEIDASELSAYLARLREAGRRVTVTHLVGRALAVALAEVPDLNVRIVGGHAIARESIDIFFITSTEGGRDLSGVKIAETDRKPALEVAEELAVRARSLKEGRDPDLAKSKSVMNRLPKPFLRAALHAATFVSEDLNRSIAALGLHESPFGSAMVTSVGMFGLPMGFAPIAWMYRVPILVLVGEITDRPVAIDGRVEIRPILPICATIDHRYADGWHISKLLKPFRDYLADPAAHEPEA